MGKRTIPKSIDGYIASAPRGVKDRLEDLREAIHKGAPDAVETIAYAIPTFRLEGENLVHFAAFKSHIGFYPTSSPIVAFKKELAPYKTSKGAVQFPSDEPLPLGLVRKIVAYRVDEVASRRN